MVGVEGFGPPPLSGVASKATAFCQFRHTPIKNDPKLVLMEQDWDLQKNKNWWLRRESNPYSIKNCCLRTARLPVPPLSLKKWYFGRDSNPQCFPLGCQILSLKCLDQLHHRSIKMAESTGFEPVEAFTPHLFSKQTP